MKRMKVMKGQPEGSLSQRRKERQGTHSSNHEEHEGQQREE